LIKRIEMIQSKQNLSLADFYFDFLKNLNPDSKLDLISKLSQSLKEKSTSAEITLESLYGAYESEETAEEIIAELRASRVFNRNIEPL